MGTSASHTMPRKPRDMLVEAAETGDLEIVTALLADGHDPEGEDRGDGKPLEAAALDGRTAAGGAPARGHLEIAAAVLADGHDPEGEDRGDGNPLEAAALHGHLAIVDALLRAGA